MTLIIKECAFLNLVASYNLLLTYLPYILYSTLLIYDTLSITLLNLINLQKDYKTSSLVKHIFSFYVYLSLMNAMQQYNVTN